MSEVTHKNYKVTLLVNNAGVMFVPETYSKDGYEMHFAAVSFLESTLLTLNKKLVHIFKFSFS